VERGAHGDRERDGRDRERRRAPQGQQRDPGQRRDGDRGARRRQPRAERDDRRQRDGACAGG